MFADSQRAGIHMWHQLEKNNSSFSYVIIDAAVPGEVGHFHHDHAHLFGQHDDVISVVVPFSDLGVQLALLLPEALHLLCDLGFLLLRELSHDGLRSKIDQYNMFYVAVTGIAHPKIEILSFTGSKPLHCCFPVKHKCDSLSQTVAIYNLQKC